MSCSGLQTIHNSSKLGAKVASDHLAPSRYWAFSIQQPLPPFGGFIGIGMGGLPLPPFGGFFAIICLFIAGSGS